MSIAKGKSQILLTIIFSPNNAIYIDYFPLIAAGALPFSVGKKYQNPTAAPDAMKASGLANWIRTALVPDENRDGITVIKVQCQRVG